MKHQNDFFSKYVKAMVNIPTPWIVLKTSVTWEWNAINLTPFIYRDLW